MLQPEVDELGRTAKGARAGWSEVRVWCERNAANLDFVLNPEIGEPIDLLVIAMDVDIAIEAGIEDPPQDVSAYEADRLLRKMRGWLGGAKRRLPQELVIALPAMAIEAWVIAALYPKHVRPEALKHPASFLVSKNKLRTADDGRPLKPTVVYKEFAKRVSGRLERVREACGEAERFCKGVESVKAWTENE